VVLLSGVKLIPPFLQAKFPVRCQSLFSRFVMAEGGLPLSDPVSPTVAEDLPQTSSVPIELIREAVRGVMAEMFPGSQPQQVPEPTTGECQGGLQ
jgi:hypothetical protein